MSHAGDTQVPGFLERGDLGMPARTDVRRRKKGGALVCEEGAAQRGVEGFGAAKCRTVRRLRRAGVLPVPYWQMPVMFWVAG